MRRRTFLMLVLSAVVAPVGCLRQRQIQYRLDQQKQLLDPMVGVATREDILGQFGIPNKKAHLGNTEVWEYHRSLGTQVSGDIFETAPNLYGTSSFAGERPYETFDQVTFTFSKNDGILKNWHSYVQR